MLRTGKNQGMSGSITGSAFELENGTPGAIRTRDLLLRRQTLYPTELRVPIRDKYNIIPSAPVFKAPKAYFQRIPPIRLEKKPFAAYIT